MWVLRGGGGGIWVKGGAEVQENELRHRQEHKDCQHRPSEGEDSETLCRIQVIHQAKEEGRRKTSCCEEKEEETKKKKKRKKNERKKNKFKGIKEPFWRVFLPL